MSKRRTKKQNLELAGRLTVWTVVALLLLVVLTFGILWLVPNAANPKRNALAAPDTIQVIPDGAYAFDEGSGRTAGTREFLKGDDGASGNTHAKIFDAYKSAIKYSVMYAIIEGNTGRVEIATHTDEEDDTKTVATEYKRDDIIAIKGSVTELLLVFKYNGTQTVKLAKETVKFDRVLIVLPDSEENLGTYTYYFIDSEALASDKDYSVHAYTAIGKTAQLFDAATAK